MKQENGKIVPEVGDVFEMRGYNTKVRVVDVDEDTDTVAVCSKYGGCICNMDDFLKCYTYLGKAKNSLESIFEVEE